MLRIGLPLVLGLAVAAFLASLGVWQLQRLVWKEGVLAEIEARIGSAPVAIPSAPDPEADRFLPVIVTGNTGPEELHVLVSQKILGAGFRVIRALEAEDGRRLLVDLGFVPNIAKDATRSAPTGAFVGNLHWPDDRDSFTPDNDVTGNYWFARDIDQMAQTLGTEPILMILRSQTPPDPDVTPLPVSTEGIPNNHFGYAVQWFGLAIVWLGMLGFFLWRRARTER